MLFLLDIAFTLIKNGEVNLILGRSLKKVFSLVIKFYILLGRQERALAAEEALDLPMPPAKDPVSLQKFFLQQIQKAELSLGMGLIDEGVRSFAIAVSVSGQQAHFLEILQQSLSPAIYMKLKEILPSIQKVNIFYVYVNQCVYILWGRAEHMLFWFIIFG